MRTGEEIRDMYNAKLKQSKSDIRPPQVKQLDAACALIFEWVLNESEEQ